MTVRTGVRNACINVQYKGNSVCLFHGLPNVRCDRVNAWPLDMVWIRCLAVGHGLDQVSGRWTWSGSGVWPLDMVWIRCLCLSLRVEGRSISPKGYSKYWNSWGWIYTKRRHGHSDGTFVANINHEDGSSKQTYKKQMQWKSVTFLIIMIRFIRTVLPWPVFNYCLKSLVLRIVLALLWVVSVSVLQVFVNFLYNIRL
jgi:hypothetical protein